MANRRMFANCVVETDKFYDMPHSAQALYFHFGMNADDEGFLDNYNSIMRTARCNVNDVQTLIDNGFLIAFPDSRLLVVRHWKRNNYLQKDRITPTAYLAERVLLATLPDKTYDLKGACIQNVYNLYTQYSLDKSRLDKSSIDKCVLYTDETQETHTRTQQQASFVPPTLEQVQAYCKERNSPVNADKFFYFNQARSWNDVWDWKGLLCYWETLPQYGPAETANDDWLETLANIGKGDGAQ